MTSREQFNAIMNYRKVNSFPLIHLEPFEDIGLKNWENQGYPHGATPHDFFKFDILEWVPVSFNVLPVFEEEILSETEDEFIKRNAMNIIMRCQKDAPNMYYGYIDHPIKSMTDWENYKLRFNALTPNRLRGNIDEIAGRLNQVNHPVILMFFPFLFRLGFYMLGMERFMLAFYDEPELIHAMFSHYTDFAIELIRPILKKVKIDMVSFCEDMAYKNGTHISPDLYEEFFLPYQNPIIQEIKSQQPETMVAMYSAGNLDALLPILLENGFNMTYPVERASHMDPYDLRKRYGKKLRLAGGFPKEALIAGKEAIDREFDYLDALIREGGFILALDDSVPPEVDLDNYQYFIDKCKKYKF